MRLGIISPYEGEIAPIIKEMRDIETENYAMLSFNVGRYANVDVVALFCGACKVNAAIAAQVLIDRYNVSHIIVTGVAGAIAARLNIFDTVVADEIAYHDVAAEILTQNHPWMKSVYFHADSNLNDGILRANTGDKTVFRGRIVTGEAYLTQTGRKDVIGKNAPLCVDMETGAAAHVCYANGVPFTAVRSINYTSAEGGHKAFEKNFNDAAEKSAKVLACYLKTL